MISANQKNLSRYQYFPSSYAQGRDWFIAAAQNAGGSVRSHPKPEVKGPGGEQLFMDTAWFGSIEAERVFVSLCGTHGQEYFCGAAGQLDWICSGGPEQLGDDVSVLLIHAVNPYGAAHCSRTNDQHIDLNRNFRDHAIPRPANSVFRKVAETISLTEISDAALYDLVDNFNELIRREDPFEVMTAIAGGQDQYPDGMAYCGREHAWETQTLLQIAKELLGHAKRAAIIDWHTGLGPAGKASVLTELDPDSEAYDLAASWWGKPANSEALYESGNEPNIEGEVRDGIAGVVTSLGGCAVQTVVEIGTVDNRAIIPAFAIDRWLRLECSNPLSPDAVKWRTIMMERYNPSLPEWRESALAEMKSLYERTLAGLRDW